MRLRSGTSTNGALTAALSHKAVRYQAVDAAIAARALFLVQIDSP